VVDINEDETDEELLESIIHREGVKKLLNDCEVFAGGGGAHHYGDVTPVTILGWSESAKTIFYREAKSTPLVVKGEGMQHYIFYDDSDGDIMIAKWRSIPDHKRGGEYYKLGSDAIISTSGYKQYSSVTGGFDQG